MSQLLPTDWATVWHAQVIAEHNQFDDLVPPASRPGPDWWRMHAARFEASTRQTPQPDAFLRQVLPAVEPGMHILDVGAGTGRYALPLARAGARVTAVEPSAGMTQYLEQRIADEHLPITIVRDRWETADVPVADVTICAHVLYPIADIAPFLRKLDRQTRQQCFVCLGFDSPNVWLAPFWRVAYGVERLLLPGAIPALAVLHQLGIDAQLTPIAPTTAWRFTDLEEALTEVRARLSLQSDPERDEAVRAALRDQLHQDADGDWRPTQTPHMAVLSWNKTRHADER